MPTQTAPPPATRAGNNPILPLPAERAGAQAVKLLLTKKELATALPMPIRSIERLVSVGVLPCLRITPRMVRFELPACMAALRKYATSTLRK